MGPGRRGPRGPTAARAGGQVDARPGAAGQQQSRPTPPCSAAPRLQSPLRGWALDDSSATAKAPPELPRDSSAPSPARTLATACAAPPLAWPCPLSGTTELLRTTQPHPRYLPLREAPPPPRLLREPAGLKAFFLSSAALLGSFCRMRYSARKAHPELFTRLHHPLSLTVSAENLAS